MPMLVALSLDNANSVPGRGANDGMRIRWPPRSARDVVPRDFAADKLHKLFHLDLHLGHFVSHIENDFDTREVHAEFARQIQNYFEAFQVLIRVKTRISLRPRWF